MEPAPDLRAVTERQRATWAAGDFHVIARQTMSVAEATVRALDPRPRARVLDVACGSGNAALVAARRYCETSAIDFVPALVARARERARAEALEVDVREADAQALPFPDASFDAVVSVFGVMFAPDQPRAAAELLRVARPGARVALASWGPFGFGGDFFGSMRAFAPPPPGLASPLRWGTREGLEELLGPRARSLAVERRTFSQYFPSLDAAVATFLASFGPVVRAAEGLDAAGRERMAGEIRRVFSSHDRARDGTLVMECEYCEALAVLG